MALSPLTLEDAVKRLAKLPGGAFDSIEALSDLVRAEVHARKHAPRAATLSRVARLLAPAALVDEERLDEVCDALEREGDVVLAPGGVLYATPTRVVALQKRARVFSSLPTRAVAAGLARDVAATGAARTVAATEDLAQKVAKAGAAMVTPEAWSGLDRTPSADAAFLAMLDHRLEWEASSIGAFEKDGALEWLTWDAAGEAARWRRSSEGRLWWARTRFGGHHRVWTAGASPATSPLVELSPDDADRARFALSRQVVGAWVLKVEPTGGGVTIEIPAWLPRPEYRWLSLHAELCPESKGMRWTATVDDGPQITRMLTERLGLVVEVR